MLRKKIVFYKRDKRFYRGFDIKGYINRVKTTEINTLLLKKRRRKNGMMGDRTNLTPGYKDKIGVVIETKLAQESEEIKQEEVKEKYIKSNKFLGVITLQFIDEDVIREKYV
eukprot:TRINITY_DN29293_c0_g1_i2.p2 TRINITY_DN29293_c0_g1~~TRINITY_DN29293_c0_g1_i2.p2  ORF type:complete len:112 (-),score=7.87 TRINITY_DN29293_c0_g1_i2:31-366(-)